MAALAALYKLHSASKQKLSKPVHSTLLDDFVYIKSLCMENLWKQINKSLPLRSVWI